MPARKSGFTRSTQFKRKLPLLSHREKYYRQVAFEEVLFLIHHASAEQAKDLLAASASGSSIIPDSPTFQASNSYADWLLICKHLDGTQRALSIFEGAICFAGKIIPEADRAGWITSCQSQLSELRRLTSEPEDIINVAAGGQAGTASPSLSEVLSRVPELTAHDAISAVATYPRRYGPSLNLLSPMLLQQKLSDGDLYDGLEHSIFRGQEVQKRLVSLTRAATLIFALVEDGDFLLKLVVSKQCGNAIARALKESAAALKKCLGGFLFTGMEQSKFCQKDPEYYKYAVQVNREHWTETYDFVVSIVLSFAAGLNLRDETSQQD